MSYIASNSIFDSFLSVSICVYMWLKKKNRKEILIFLFFFIKSEPLRYYNKDNCGGALEMIYIITNIYLFIGLIYAIRTLYFEFSYLSFHKKIILAIFVVLTWPSLFYADLFFFKLKLKNNKVT